MGLASEIVVKGHDVILIYFAFYSVFTSFFALVIGVMSSRDPNAAHKDLMDPTVGDSMCSTKPLVKVRRYIMTVSPGLS
jgi:hypothetical protein